jgi:hypothetical protein
MCLHRVTACRVGLTVLVAYWLVGLVLEVRHSHLT